VAPKRQGGATPISLAMSHSKRGLSGISCGLQQSPFGEPQPAFFLTDLPDGFSKKLNWQHGMGGPFLVHVTDDSAEMVSTIEAANFGNAGWFRETLSSVGKDRDDT
jgi:hypothetical protein